MDICLGTEGILFPHKRSWNLISDSRFGSKNDSNTNLIPVLSSGHGLIEIPFRLWKMKKDMLTDLAKEVGLILYCLSHLTCLNVSCVGQKRFDQIKQSNAESTCKVLTGSKDDCTENQNAHQQFRLITRLPSRDSCSFGVVLCAATDIVVTHCKWSLLGAA